MPLKFSISRISLISFLIILTSCTTPPPIKPSDVIPIAQLDRGVLILIPVEKVQFEFGKANLSGKDSLSFLERVSTLLKNKTDKKISLEGHTDNVGNHEVNQRLSIERAKAIRDELVKTGVSADRFNLVGFSFDHPLVKNDTEEGRSLNRRVELIILDEKVENITRGEPANAFEEAFSRLKNYVDSGALKPTDPSIQHQ